jgi:hypothetical protein
MTYGELYKLVGNRPFVMALTKEAEFVVWYPDEETFCALNDGYEYVEPKEANPLDSDLAPYVLMDWFEETEAPSSPSLCTCDFYEVVLRTGCKCRGK